MKIGCQTYTWQMSGALYEGRLDHIINVAGRAGFAGVESELHFLGPLKDPAKMRATLDRAGISLASLCLAKDWHNAEETETERQSADWVTAFLADHFPQAILNLCPLPRVDRTNLRKRQDNQLACMNAIAERAAERGLVCGYHPNSPAGSVCRNVDDYAYMLSGLNTRYLGWIPDIGHIAKGGIDPLTLLNEWRDLIVHVHYKDMSKGGVWQVMNKGALPFPQITDYLRKTGYEGWLIVEDESAAAEEHPDTIAKVDADYMRRLV